MTDLARSMVLDATTGVLINGQPFPYWVSEDVHVEPGGRDGVTIVNLPLLVDGVVLIVDHKGSRRVIDGALGGLGDVGEWARNHVREELAAAFPWLQIEAPAERRLKTLQQLAQDIAATTDYTESEALYHLGKAIDFKVRA